MNNNINVSIAVTGIASSLNLLNIRPYAARDIVFSFLDSAGVVLEGYDDNIAEKLLGMGKNSLPAKLEAGCPCTVTTVCIESEGKV